VAERQTLRS